MRQREIYWLNLNSVKGSEQVGKRPFVIISGNSMNENFGVSIVCPISSKINNYTSCVELKRNKLNNLSTDSEIITFQIRTVSHEHFLEKIGEISTSELKEILSGLVDVLQL